MAKLDPLSPGLTFNSALPRQQRSRPPRSGISNGAPDSAPGNFDNQGYNHSSPATNNSLSPPPTESALSFDSFAPNGPTDPFALDAAASVAASNNADSANIDALMAGEFFQPPLPFDNHIVQSLQSLTDPTGWQDISLPGMSLSKLYNDYLLITCLTLRI